MAVAASPGRNRRSHLPLRILTAVPLCDGHDSAIMTINQELVAHGAEVVYLGYHQSASAIARAAVQEDVHAVGISSYNGGHTLFFREVVEQLRRRGAPDIRVFGGGGGTITSADERDMRRFGVERIFSAGTPLGAIVRDIMGCKRPLRGERGLVGDRRLARAITLAEARPTGSATAASGGSTTRLRRSRMPPALPPGRRGFVLGVAGPGGAGKSTLIDELTSRFLRQQQGRVAILANDPSQPDSGGALLGDRVSAIYAQHDRVFFRSIATRGSPTGVSASAAAALDLLRRTGEFELIVIESVGIGQESDPFGSVGNHSRLVDTTLFVTSPHYGGSIQLQKIALLNAADLVALNKCDDPRAGTARVEICSALTRRDGKTPLHLTIAARHHDGGIDELYAAIAELGGLDRAGGERPCHLKVEE